jgi:hypothetical protein
MTVAPQSQAGPRIHKGLPRQLLNRIVSVDMPAFRAVCPDRHAPDPAPLPLKPEHDAG